MVFWSGYERDLRLGFDPDGGGASRHLRIWVPRVHCPSCGATPGLLPAFCLARRLDEVEVIGLALVWVVDGRMVAAAAALLAVARGTLRGWVARFAYRAQGIAYRFAGLAIEWGSEVFDLPAPPTRAAIEAIGRAFEAARRRLAGNVVPLWRFVCAVSGGAVLATNRSPP
ncbi:MAG TPA: hypothetical protein VFW71_02730 [Actinomycetota bacterium]|nr:hypothetical protein [Actinomycetota bacterium]